MSRSPAHKEQSGAIRKPSGRGYLPDHAAIRAGIACPISIEVPAMQAGQRGKAEPAPARPDGAQSVVRDASTKRMKIPTRQSSGSGD